MAAKLKKTKSSKKKITKPAALAGFTAQALDAIGEPVGACFWVDNIGQNHCNITSQSQCATLKGKFFAGKRCPGGV